MSATDELRRLLDERGVEWGSGFGGDTLWTGRHGIEWRWDKQENTLAMYSHKITPEQAIAATLGGGECENVSKHTGVFVCSNCGAKWETEDIDLIEPLLLVDGVAEYPSYCQHCGFKIREAVER